MKKLNLSFAIILMVNLITNTACQSLNELAQSLDPNNNQTQSETSPTQDTSEKAPNPISKSKMILSKSGGQIKSADNNLTIKIAANAISQDTEISISNIIKDGKVIGYDFKPDGLIFNEPAVVNYSVNLDNMQEILDENGDPIDPSAGIPSTTLFLIDTDGSTEILSGTHTEKNEENGTLSITAKIPHFTSLYTSAGNSYYVYLASLGTHYVGSDFKRDLDIRYLGYSGVNSYKNMSLSYTVKSITVKKIKFEDSGQIDLVSPQEITRSDYLSQRGQTSSTRPKFNCKDPGDGTIKATVEVDAIIEVVFQPENKTRVYSVSQTESVTRKGKCIARISLNDYNNSGTNGEYVSTGNQSGVMVASNDKFIPAEEETFPAAIDITGVEANLLGNDTLEVLVSFNGDLNEIMPETLSSVSYDILILEDGVGDTGYLPFNNALWDIALLADAFHPILAPAFFHWDGEIMYEEMGLNMEHFIEGNLLSLLIPLDQLNLSIDDLNDLQLRAVSQALVPGEDEKLLFVDQVDFEI
ncbi:hypothetical protein BVY03_02580 [bacterium K02(2017)]|nr:hypothetical protein BVY03_02580 [bacterium K02(2017)]